MSEHFTPNHPAFQDLTGATYNGWVVESYRKGKRWILRCPHCGRKRTISTRQISSGYGGECNCVSVAAFERRLSELDSGFGNWLAGFIDGEGCFSISRKWLKKRKTVSHGLQFHIGVRRDDLPILEEIAARTGLGVIRLTTQANVENPGARWKVYSKDDCFNLIKLLDKFPLRAKKKRDYLLWKEAGAVWKKISRLSPHWQQKGRGQDLQDKMAEISGSLKALKEYQVI